MLPDSELRDVVVRVSAVPRLALVHVELDVGGLVLTPAQAAAIARDLKRAAAQARSHEPPSHGARRRGRPAAAAR